ncbi:MAG: beta-L-arabinofuranosidase domain-containing protein [Pirellulaceae bacterium]
MSTWLKFCLAVMSSLLFVPDARKAAAQESLTSVAAPPATAAATQLPEVLPRPREVELRGPLGEVLRRGLLRLSEAPYDNLPWIQADLDPSLPVDRIFREWSGDVSGRYIEVMSLTSTREPTASDLLSDLLRAVPNLQKPDGHFGGEIGNAVQTLEFRQQPVFWGNARLLVALVTAARELQQPELLGPAKRIGDFFVPIVDAVCVPQNAARWKDEAQDSFSFVTDFFPAVEGLALLYETTRDAHYLAAAERMAEFFLQFDHEPNGHSHGNMSAWRGILELYRVTGKTLYREQSVRKWERVTRHGFVWPIGGTGEGWSLGGGLKNAVGGRSITEACADSDWLRFNLALWHDTGDTRYLDLAERHVHNQYLANQALNGGHGHRPVLVDSQGLITGLDGVAACDATWCCSLHGPLGLVYLKSYLAAGSDTGVFVNFPLDFTSQVTSRGVAWTVTCRARPDYLSGRAELDIELASQGTTPAGPDPVPVPVPVQNTLLVRMPVWASSVRVTDADGHAVTAPLADGYLRIERAFAAGDPLHMVFETGLALEGRAGQKIDVQRGEVTRVPDAALTAGPLVLFASGLRSPTNLLLLSDAQGRLRSLAMGDNRLRTIALPSPETTAEQLVTATDPREVSLAPWSGAPAATLFVNHWLVVQENTWSEATRSKLSVLASSAARSVFGENLEQRPQFWNAPAGWRFTPAGVEVARRWSIQAEDLVVSGGGIGLWAGEGYRDYRFEFAVCLPRESDGVVGWVVRAKNPCEGILFQIESADSTQLAERDPRTRPNSLRSYVVRPGDLGSRLELKDVVSLPKPVMRGESHEVAVECVRDGISVSLDGLVVHTQKDYGMADGSVGFRAGAGMEDGSRGANEVGLFRQIRLTQR